MKRPVALSECQDYAPERVHAAVERVLEPLGGWAAWVRPGARVLLKPNLVIASGPEAAATTHPAVVEAVLRGLSDLGAQISIGDSPAFNYAARVADAAGIGEVARRYGARVVEFDRPVWRESAAPEVMRRFTVDRSVVEADVVVNLPKLKVHRQLGFTGAAKNLYGCMPGKRKAYYHFSRGSRDHSFALLQAAYAYTVPTTLHLADAVVALERDGPTGGDPRAVGALVASTDAAACDAVLAELICVPEENRLMAEACAELGLGAPTMEQVELRGADAVETLARLRVPDFVHPLLIGVRFSPARLARSVWRNHQLMRTPSPAA